MDSNYITSPIRLACSVMKHPDGSIIVGLRNSDEFISEGDMVYDVFDHRVHSWYGNDTITPSGLLKVLVFMPRSYGAENAFSYSLMSDSKHDDQVYYLSDETFKNIEALFDDTSSEDIYTFKMKDMSGGYGDGYKADCYMSIHHNPPRIELVEAFGSKTITQDINSIVATTYTMKDLIELLTPISDLLCYVTGHQSLFSDRIRDLIEASNDSMDVLLNKHPKDE